MSFQDELDKLTRVRRAFLRFARDVNPGASWSGAEDRRYGKTHDPLADIPINGTVEAFGTFRNALANHRFTLEIPSVQTTLFDPDNEWRALGDRPSHLLLNKRVEYYLRQQDDTGAVLDQLIAMGQIAEPRFPPGKVTLDLKVPGGDFLGEDVGRRLVTTRDWPRAHPDTLGKVVPFVYGVLSNIPPVLPVASPGEIPGGVGCTDTDVPDAEIANPGAYTPVGGGTLASVTSDPPSSDATYAESPDDPSGAVAVVRLSGVNLTIGSSASLRVRAGTADAAGDPVSLTVEMRQGYVNESSLGTLIGTWTQSNISPGGFAFYTFTLTAEQIAAITTPTDLYVRWSMSIS